MPNLPVVSVTVNGQTINDFVRGWNVGTEFGYHTAATLDLLYLGPFSSASAVPVYAELSPVAVTYGIVPDLYVFYGYINHHETMSDPARSPKVHMRYVLLGTSQPMNNEKTRSWSNISASYIARQVARDNGLRCIVSPSSRVLDYWAQPGESDLTLMNDLAKEVGFRFFVDGSTLYFTDPNLLLTGPVASDIPTFSYERQPGLPDTLIDFHSIAGQNVPGQGINSTRVVFGFDQRTSKGFKYSTAVNAGTPINTTTPYLQQVATKNYVRNYGHAKAVLDAAVLNNRDWLQSQVTVIGTPRLKPGYLVNLTGSALPSNATGLWFVLSAEHIIIPSRIGSGTTARYQSQLLLSRNTDSGVSFTRTHDLTSSHESMGCQLTTQNTWQANVMETIFV